MIKPIPMILKNINCPTAKIKYDFFDDVYKRGKWLNIVNLYKNSGLPLDVKAYIEVHQELNGQEYPYPAGSGRNKLICTIGKLELLNTSGTWNNYAYTTNGVTFTVQFDKFDNITGIKVNGTTPSGSPARFILADPTSVPNNCILSGIPSDLESYCGIDIYDGATRIADIYRTHDEAQVPAGEYDEISIYVSDATTISNKVFTPMLRPATDTDTTFAPSYNYCPLNGYSDCHIHLRSRNLCPPIMNEDIRTSNGIRYEFNADGSVHVSGTATEESLSMTAPTVSDLSHYPVLPRGKYYLTGVPVDDNKVRLYGQFRDKNNNVVPQLVNGNLQNTITALGNGIYYFEIVEPCCVYVRADILSGATVDTTFYPAIHTWTDEGIYMPYINGNDYTFDFSGGGTVYGGVLDVDTGVLTITHTVLNAANASSSTYGLGTSSPYIILYLSKPAESDSSEALCSLYRRNYPPDTGLSGQYRLYTNRAVVYDRRFTGKDQALATLQADDFAIVYPLATQETLQLSPELIQSLIGDSTIWTDEGEVYVTYFSKEEAQA